MELNRESLRCSSIADLETNTLYIMCRAADLILRDIDRRLRAEGSAYKREKKQLVTSILRDCEDVRRRYELLEQDVIRRARSGEQYDWFNEDANELARLVLLFADRSSDPDNPNAVFRLLRSQTGAGILTEEHLKRFYMKK